VIFIRVEDFLLARSRYKATGLKTNFPTKVEMSLARKRETRVSFSNSKYKTGLAESIPSGQATKKNYL
jgi:hypothetical protein